jgi:hypothetical protein
MAKGARVCAFAALTMHTLVGALLAQPRKALCPMPQTIYYNRFVHQPGRTNPHRNATIQNPFSKTKKQNWLFKLPFTPAGVKGRGGKRGDIQKSHRENLYKNQVSPD